MRDIGALIARCVRVVRVREYHGAPGICRRIYIGARTDNAKAGRGGLGGSGLGHGNILHGG